jgi:hypothetical protein
MRIRGRSHFMLRASAQETVTPQGRASCCEYKVRVAWRIAWHSSYKQEHPLLDRDMVTTSQ